jgi:hypothetical protein
MDAERRDRTGADSSTLLPAVVVRSAAFPWEVVLSLAHPRAAGAAGAVVRLGRQALGLLAAAPGAHPAPALAPGADARPAALRAGREGAAAAHWQRRHLATAAELRDGEQRFAPSSAALPRGRTRHAATASAPLSVAREPITRWADRGDAAARSLDAPLGATPTRPTAHLAAERAE